MNPRTIGSANIKTFGFKTIFDTENNKIIFEDLSTFETGGALNVVGISFEIIDPFGTTLHAIQFGTPDIDPNTDDEYEFALPGSRPAWGIYKVRGVIRDQDMQEYEIIIPPVNVCEPKGFAKGVVTGSFKEKVDCGSPYIRLNETTDFIYNSKAYDSVTKTGNLYYPLGTIAAVAFTKTPVQNNVLYTGDYVVRNKSIADYDMGSFFFVRIAYSTNYKFNVTCQSGTCDIACCIEEVYNTYKENCNTAKGKDAKKKLDEIQPHFLTAISKERCGKDSGEQIAAIRDILKCDCECGSKFVEPTPINAGGGNTLTFDEECAAEVETVPEGSNTTVTIKVKHVIVAKSDPDDPHFSIEKVEDECNVTYKVTFDVAAIGNTIMATQSFSDTVNNLIGDYLAGNNIAGIDLSEIDGRCIIDLTKCDYSLSYDIPVNGATIKSIRINGDTFNAPGGALAVNSPGAIATWLDGLGKGNFSVSYTGDGTGGLFSITSDDNEYTVNNALFSVSAADQERAFAKTCTTLEQILDQIISYICNLDASQVKLGEPMSICNIVGGVAIPTAYGPSTKINTFLKDLSVSYCTLVNTVSALAVLTCSDIVGLFATSGAPIGANDFYLGTKGGICASGTIKELAIAIFKLAQTDGEVKAEFCAVSCSPAACPAVKDVVVTMDQA